MSAEVAAAPARRELWRRLLAGHRLALAGVLALAALLDFFRLDQNGYANTYYAAAVRSMLEGWRNFFFVSFDPGGLVAVDKPPLALWAQAASAKLFGYSGLALLFPQALAGVAAVFLLYLLVARGFGRPAGLTAALALAVSPVSVAVNRDNNPDALLAFLLVAAAYLTVRALDTGRLRWLTAAAATVGLAFNTKTLAALLLVPALALAYLCFAPHPRRTRLAHLALAALLLTLVSGAWIAAVDLTPASQRPYVGSTSDNSALSLALDYNGVSRLTGEAEATAFSFPGLAELFAGSPGPLRLTNEALGDQGGWLLALAVLGGGSALLAAARARRRRELAVLCAAGGWFLAAAAVFSFSSGIIHTYYLAALAPATSALTGIGALALWRDARRGGPRLALPLAALALTCWLELVLLRRTGYQPWLQPLATGALAAACLALAALASPRLRASRLQPRLATAALGLGVAAALLPPAVWAASTFAGPANGVFPGAGPNFVPDLEVAVPARAAFGPPGASLGFVPPAGGVGMPGSNFSADPAIGETLDADAALLYAKTHEPGSRWDLIVSSEQEAAPYVIRGERVAAMGGFTGRETVLTPAYLAGLVRSGEARYFLVAGFGPPAGPNAAVATVRSACAEVAATAWVGLARSSGVFAGNSLYDCGGRAAAIAGG